MPGPEIRTGGGLIAAFRALPADSPKRAFAIVIAVCIVCSVLVSGAAVMLQPIQKVNELRIKQRQILQSAGLYERGRDVVEQFRVITPRMVNLETGAYLEVSDPLAFDIVKASRDPVVSEAVPAGLDVAKIRRRPGRMPVYLVEHDGATETVVLPVHGYGLWSTMYGFLALDGSGRVVKGISFYQHAETPGLGAEIDNPAWQRLWVGKQALAPDGAVLLEVIKGTPRGEAAAWQVDGIAGATITARGVNNLVHYWLGEQGYGPYLARLRAGSGGRPDES